MYIYIYKCVYVSMYITCIHKYAFVCVYICIHMCMCIYIYTHKCILYTYAYIYTYIYICTYASIYICIHLGMYIYIICELYVYTFVVYAYIYIDYSVLSLHIFTHLSRADKVLPNTTHPIHFASLSGCSSVTTFHLCGGNLNKKEF